MAETAAVATEVAAEDSVEVAVVLAAVIVIPTAAVVSAEVVEVAEVVAVASGALVLMTIAALVAAVAAAGTARATPGKVASREEAQVVLTAPQAPLAARNRLVQAHPASQPPAPAHLTADSEEAPTGAEAVSAEHPKKKETPFTWAT